MFVSASDVARLSAHFGKPLSRKQKRVHKANKAKPQVSSPPLVPDDFVAKLIERAKEHDLEVAQRRIDAAAAKTLFFKGDVSSLPALRHAKCPPKILVTSKLAKPEFPGKRTQAFAKSVDTALIDVNKRLPEPFVGPCYTAPAAAARPEPPNTAKVLAGFLSDLEAISAAADIRRAQQQADARIHATLRRFARDFPVAFSEAIYASLGWA